MSNFTVKQTNLDLNTALGPAFELSAQPGLSFQLAMKADQEFTLTVGTKSSSLFAGGGEQGPQGIQGIQGEQGIKGDQGIQGIQGEIGLQGPIGPVGSIGPQGIVGPVGPESTVAGARGLKGDKGDEGDQGERGLPGYSNISGPTGPQGPIGPKGDKGDTGSIGSPGPVGIVGPQGQAGVSNVPGPQGPSGPQGNPGPIGPIGPIGNNGLGVPAGGTIGQVLSKTTEADNDTSWIDPPAGSGGGESDNVADFYGAFKSFDHATTTTATWTTIPMSSSASDPYGFDALNSFVVPVGVQKIVLSGSIRPTANINNQFQLIKNGSFLDSKDGGFNVEIPESGYSNGGISFSSAVINVVDGDIFQLKYYVASSIGLTGFFQVEAIKHSFGTAISGFVTATLNLRPIIDASRSLVDADFALGAFIDVIHPTDQILITIPIGITSTEPVTFQQSGNGVVSFNPAPGVIIHSYEDKLTIIGKYASATLLPKGGDVYALIGALA